MPFGKPGKPGIPEIPDRIHEYLIITEHLDCCWYMFLAVLAHLASFSFRFFLGFSFYFGALEALLGDSQVQGTWRYITPTG